MNGLLTECHCQEELAKHSSVFPHREDLDFSLNFSFQVCFLFLFFVFPIICLFQTSAFHLGHGNSGEIIIKVFHV